MRFDIHRYNTYSINKAIVKTTSSKNEIFEEKWGDPSTRGRDPAICIYVRVEFSR